MIRKIEIERFSLITSKKFDDVTAALRAGIGRPDMAEFWKSAHAAPSAAKLESMIETAVGKTGLMLFVAFDHGAIVGKTTGRESRIIRFLIGNPLIMKEMVKHAPDAGSYAPITILIDEREHGVHLSYDLTASFLASYENAKGSAVARDLDGKVESLIRESAL